MIEPGAEFLALSSQNTLNLKVLAPAITVLRLQHVRERIPLFLCQFGGKNQIYNSV